MAKVSWIPVPPGISHSRNKPLLNVPEAIIYVEFDHHSDTGFLQQLNQEIQTVLAEVQACVADFPAMLARLAAGAAATGKTPVKNGPAIISRPPIFCAGWVITILPFSLVTNLNWIAVIRSR